MTDLINLHSHSRYSDGTLSPAELAAEAARAGVRYFSLTDHDITAGWDELEPRLRELKVRFVRGLELSTRLHDNLHVLGYGVDIGNRGLQEKLAEFRERRISRVKKILALLREQGHNISFEELRIGSDHCCGRPHVADLMRRKGLVKTRQKAFEKYIAYGKPAYVPPCGPDMEEAIKIVKAAGGLAVLAHPGVVRNILELEKWKEMGLDGIEAFYPAHSNALTREFLQMAKTCGLLVTAGTDFHGPGTGRDEMYGFEFHEEFFGWARDMFL